MKCAALVLATAVAAACAAHAEPASAPKIGPNTYAQHLVDQALAASPDVLVMAMHVTPPGAQTNVIIASNIGRIGKAADADDLGVIATGQTKLSVNGGVKFEVLETLKDLSGDAVGAIGVVFPYHPGDDQQALRVRGEAIRDKLAARISNVGNLLDPWPYDPAVSDDTYAQQLVDKTLAAHPDVIILAIHATPPGSTSNMIVGSNIGRIGKKADDDDLRVIEQGSINKEVNESGKRFEAELPLNDAQGQRIGALGVVFNYAAGDDKEALVARAVKIRDEMAAQIASPAALAAKPR
jgi:hypothetical protein